MDVCEKSGFARIIESILFLFTYSGRSLSEEAISNLVDALQSPHCRLTEFKVDGESTCDMLGWGVFVSLVNFALWDCRREAKLARLFWWPPHGLGVT